MLEVFVTTDDGNLASWSLRCSRSKTPTGFSHVGFLLWRQGDRDRIYIGISSFLFVFVLRQDLST